MPGATLTWCASPPTWNVAASTSNESRKPMPRTSHPERHRSDRIGWLRAAVLGANDGIVSTASLLVGAALPLAVAALAPSRALILSVSAASLVCLAALGVVAARAGGAAALASAWRVTLWGAVAMAIAQALKSSGSTITFFSKMPLSANRS